VVRITSFLGDRPMTKSTLFVSGVLEWVRRDRIDSCGTVMAQFAERVRHQPLPHRQEDDGQDGEGDAEARNLLGHGALVCLESAPASGAQFVARNIDASVGFPNGPRQMALCGEGRPPRRWDTLNR
jgi:hypothetical protein